MIRLACAAFILTCAAAAARAETYAIETDHTRAEFRVSHLGFSEMPGVFNDIKGKIEFDPAKTSVAKVEAVINADAVTMNQAALDGKLKGSDFFNTAKYPVIRFISTSVERLGTDEGTIKGDLTMLGVTKPVELKVKLNKKGWNKYMGTDEVGFTAWAKIHRSDFGMTYILPDVGDDVTIRLDVEALKAKPGEVIDMAAKVKVIDTVKKEESAAPAKVEDKKTAAPEAVKTPADQKTDASVKTQPQTGEESAPAQSSIPPVTGNKKPHTGTF